MSRAGPRAARKTHDAYYTPQPCADALVEALVARYGNPGLGAVLEPSVGGGAFARALQPHCHHLAVCDIDPDAPGLSLVDGDAAQVCDFLAAPVSGWDWIVGNPEYLHAREHIEHAIQGGRNVAFLLRAGFIESKKRRDFWEKNPADHVFWLADRPSFTGGGTDSAMYGLFVWPLRKPESTWEILNWK